MRERLLTILVFLLAGLPLFAVPAYPGVLEALIKEQSRRFAGRPSTGSGTAGE